MSPHLQSGFEKQIYDVNYHLLGHAWVSHPDCIDNPAMILQLKSPRTCIQVLGERAYPRESVQRYDDSPPALPKEWVTRLFEKAEVELLDSIHHFSKIILLDGVCHRGQSGFKIVEWKFLFDNKPGCQSLQCAAKLVDLDDVGIAQFEDSSAAPMSLGYKALGGQNVQCFAD